MEGRFKVCLSEDGASKLADRLTDNLKAYMGDFVDDTLVKYVIVLLGNGRSKEEVKEDLDVFLGDNTHSFVTWLWDHLSSHLHLYEHVQPPLPPPQSLPKPIPESDAPLPSSESNKPKHRHNRDWKPISSHPPPLRSSITTVPQSDSKPISPPPRPRDSVSPQRTHNHKRSRPHDSSRPNRDPSQPSVAASRRLLQFAVRDAVAPARPSPSDSIPSRKRLRSVVSSPHDASPVETQPHRMQPVSRALNPMATAIRAVAEAALDVKRVKTGNVFDRLSRGADERSELVSTFREPVVLGTKYEDFDAMHSNALDMYDVQTRGYNGLYNGNASIMDSNTGLASDSASDNEGYENLNFVGSRGKGISETRTSRGNKADDSLMVQYSVAQNTDEVAHHSRKKGQEQSPSAPGAKQKIVNISVNVNTWKPPHYQPAREIVEVLSPKPAQKNGTGLNSLNAKGNKNHIPVSGDGKPVDFEKENQKSASPPGPYSIGRPLEDADLRTIFVSNVHFAATKDTLSRHFNKFGNVLKVIILTDVVTGHPKGSAYVEFMRKEAAENALSLDGTSFMSRIIKVLKKSSGQQEISPVMTWPRITRGSSFTAPRFTQAPFARVFPGAFRGRAVMKPGARSMQWKRDAQQTSTENVASSSEISTNGVSGGRGLTYVRAESKPDLNAAGA